MSGMFCTKRIIDNHGLTGIPAFSRVSFAKQLSIPGAVVLRATYNGVTIGAQIYFMQGDVVYCHLGGQPIKPATIWEPFMHWTYFPLSIFPIKRIG